MSSRIARATQSDPVSEATNHSAQSLQVISALQVSKSIPWSYLPHAMIVFFSWLFVRFETGSHCIALPALAL